MPALPLDEAGRYVAAAYTVFVVLLVIYVGLMAAKLGRISREIDELAEMAEGLGAAPNDRSREIGAAGSVARSA